MINVRKAITGNKMYRVCGGCIWAHILNLFNAPFKICSIIHISVIFSITPIDIQDLYALRVKNNPMLLNQKYN